MLRRKYLFPNVIEMNYQAGRRLGVNVYLIDGGDGEFVLIDIGFEDTVDEIIELIRQMDFNLSTCKMIIATHADADHIQGLSAAKELAQDEGRRPPAERRRRSRRGDEIVTYATHQGPGHRHPDAGRARSTSCSTRATCSRSAS